MKRFFSRSDNARRDLLTSNFIVLLFVLAHALTCLVLHDTKVGDGIFLTCLTIAMVFALIKFYGATFDVFLGLAFLSCFAGFYIGTEGAGLLERAVPSWGVWINVIVTMVTTGVLGEIIILLVRRNWHVKGR
ncbi:MAG TPA: hypothetical protein IAC05_03295 [Candidatus Coprenecus stercorigallinarum]|nr:hypothetical protein [Candidatus Coprenecus stercorigallinarum]